MQTKMKLRLLKKNENSPSGYKIVGYQMKAPVNINEGEIGDFFGKYIPEDTWFSHMRPYVVHDAFELGIKVGDNWWFEGDKFELVRRDHLYFLAFNDVEFEFLKIPLRASEGITRDMDIIPLRMVGPREVTCVGNIHEGVKEEMEKGA